MPFRPRRRSKPCRHKWTFTQCISLMKRILRVWAFFALLGSVTAQGVDEDVVDHKGGGTGQAIGHTLWWTVCGISVLALELLVGVFLFFLIGDVLAREEFPAFVHLLAQFMPLFATFGHGWVDCETGLWWPVHWLYMLVLVLAMPALGNAIERDKASIPVFGWKGSCLAQLYLYFTSMLGASDQYLDSMTAAIALQCGWPLAWLMIMVIFTSLALQSLAAAMSASKIQSTRNKSRDGALTVLTGMAPEAMGLNDDEYSRRYAASQGVAKLVTENVPQAYLSIKFANEVKPSKMVWFSVALSLILATKSFVNGLLYFCCSQAESDSEEESSEESSEE